ncbi:hypothetical protein F4778DRAFT_307369 [Xylariomycetidae sp. FL2044]|nr:hypothetical protein F4778DRAFT_307369 [Xylariomycetidae sp. FL2044]
MLPIQKSPPRPQSTSLRVRPRDVRLMSPITEYEEEEEEEEDDAPQIPARNPRRVTLIERYHDQRRDRLPPYPRNGGDDSPPLSSGSLKPPSELPRRQKRPNWIVRRGGWYRVVLITLVGVVSLVGLVVGLVLGLRYSSSNSNSSSPASGTPETQQLPVLFPAGSYSFETALANVSTACTTNPSAFRCYPYTLYNASHSASAATFTWIISETAPSTFTISSSANPFAPQFAGVALGLLDANQPSERLIFSVALGNITVTPQGPLAGGDQQDAAATRCYYGDTVLSATIWTRRAAQYPDDGLDTDVDNAGNGTHTSQDFDPWPYGVEVRQLSGPGGPDCRDLAGNPVGDFAVPGGAGGECGCWYANIGLS